MKVLQINKYFYAKGGAETVFFNTMELLEREGHTVIPFCLKSPRNRPSQYAKYFVDYPELSESGLWTRLKHAGTFLYNRNAARQLERLIKDEKPDIAHIHLMFNSFSVSILPVLKKHNVPVVMSLHDYRLICPAYTFIDGKGLLCERCLQGGRYWHCITNKCSNGIFLNSLMLTLDSYFRRYFISPINYVDKFIFVGEFARKKHISVDSGFKDKSVVLHNFTAIKGQEPSDKENYLLYFGRISKEKGISYLIKAVESLPNVNLKIAGQGPLLEALSKRHLHPNIEFVGHKSGKELRDYIRKAMFVIVPSIWYENNPMAILEACTLGTPVIAGRIGGIPELIEDNRTGFLVEPRRSEELKEKIRQALALTAGEYAAMCNEAKAFAKAHFTPEIYYKKLFSIYNEVIENRK